MSTQQHSLSYWFQYGGVCVAFSIQISVITYNKFECIGSKATADQFTYYKPSSSNSTGSCLLPISIFT